MEANSGFNLENLSTTEKKKTHHHEHESGTLLLTVVIYRLHGTKSQKTVMFIITRMTTSNAPVMSAAVSPERNMKCSVSSIQLVMQSTDWISDKPEQTEGELEMSVSTNERI
jgi:hypothetical protein